MMATWMWLNIPMMVLAFALTAGIPAWLVLRRADADVAPVVSLARAARPESGESIAYPAAA
jgi:hypothetical protein